MPFVKQLNCFGQLLLHKGCSSSFGHQHWLSSSRATYVHARVSAVFLPAGKPPSSWPAGWTSIQLVESWLNQPLSKKVTDEAQAVDEAAGKIAGVIAAWQSLPPTSEVDMAMLPSITALAEPLLTMTAPMAPALGPNGFEGNTIFNRNPCFLSASFY
eukprot:365877-Chlamydomonas_euryale.AAC.1